MNKKIKILTIGHFYSFYDNDGKSNMCHSCEALRYEMSYNLSKLNCEVHMLSMYFMDKKISDSLYVKDMSNLNVNEYDAIIFFELMSWQQFIETSKLDVFKGKCEDIFKHKCIITLCIGSDENINKMILQTNRLVCIMSHRRMYEWIENYGTENPEVMWLEWGVPEGIVCKVDNPYDTNVKNILLTSVIKHRYIDIINYIAEKLDANIYIFGIFDLLSFDSEFLQNKNIKIINNSLSHEDKVKIFPSEKIKLVTEIDLNNNGGLFKYGTFWEYFKYADAALCFSTEPMQININSKIYDYLLFGIPVIVEKGNPQSYLIEKIKGGKVAEFNNRDSIVECLRCVLNFGADKKRIIDFMITNHTWFIRSKRLYYKILEIIAS